MIDSFGRNIDYMRVSITDRCNLRCKYCMPHGIQWLPMEEILTFEEMAEVCKQAAGLGIRKIKVTGGEPLVRKGCCDFVRMLKQIPGIEQVTLTTNGVLLTQYARELCDAGIDAVNVSLDTLDREKYREITGFDALLQVLAGMEAMERTGIPVKMNTVLQPGKNDGEWMELAMLAKDKKLDVRFIEMMPIGHGDEFEPVSNVWLLEKLRETFKEVEEDKTIHGNGPAVYYRIPGFKGSIGFISAIHGKFCHNCNRIRMTATGQLKPCLCYEDSISVREELRKGHMDKVGQLIAEAAGSKPLGHCFEHREIITERREMAKIGG